MFFFSFVPLFFRLSLFFLKNFLKKSVARADANTRENIEQFQLGK